METLNELALFAGAGGGILGGLLCGFRTVCAVEHDPYSRDVLVSRQNDGCLAPFPIWDDVCTFDGRPWRGVVDVVSGGFPCQDISSAGKGVGITGERSGLWKEMSRIIREVGPGLVLVENSPVLTSRGLGVVLGDLASMGYDARWGVLGAVHAGAPHKRERIWIVAYGHSARKQQQTGSEQKEREWSGNASEDVSHTELPERRPQCEACNGLERQYGIPQRQKSPSGAGGCCEVVADAMRGGFKTKRQSRKVESETESEGRSGHQSPLSFDRCSEGDTSLSNTNGGRHGSSEETIRAGWDPTELGGWWLTEPDVGRVAHGVAARVDRLRNLGNGQVSAVVRLAWRLLRPSKLNTEVSHAEQSINSKS